MKPQQTVAPPPTITAQKRIAATLQIKVSGLFATHADAVAVLIVSNQIPGVVFSAVYGD